MARQTAFDKRFRKLARKLVRKFGKDVTLRKNDKSMPVGSSSTSVTSTDTSLRGVIIDATRKMVDDGIVQEGGKVVLVDDVSAAQEIRPVEHALVIDDREYPILEANPIWSGEQKALWALRVNL